MAVVSIATLKTYFQTGDFPNEQEFINTIDTLSATIRVVSFTYDFSIHGGTIGTKLMGVTIPSGCIVLKQMFKVITPLTSLGASTITTGWVGSNLAIGGTAVAYTNFNTLAPLDMALWHIMATTADPSYTFPTPSSEIELNYTIGGANLTDGKMTIKTLYIEL